MEVRPAVLSGNHDLAVRFLLSQVDVIWQHGMIDYLLLRATKPPE